MSSSFTLNSDKQFIHAFKLQNLVGINVYEYEGNLQDVSGTMHSSRWKYANAITDSGQSLEVHRVKFATLTQEFASLTSDLTLTSEDGARTIGLRVNRNGVCFVNVSENVWVRAKNLLFSWSNHGVKLPPRGSEILDALGMVKRVNGAVWPELLSLRGRSEKLMAEDEKLMKENDNLMKETASFLGGLVEEIKKETAPVLEEVASLKNVLKDKAEEMTSIKAALGALMDKS